MKAKDVKIGKKVIYHPIIGESYGEEAVITSDVFDFCGTKCCNIDIRNCVIDIAALEEV